MARLSARILVSLGVVAACSLCEGLISDCRKTLAIPPSCEGVQHGSSQCVSRRSSIAAFGGWLLVGAGGSLLDPLPAAAAADCFTDCLKNCKLIAPKDPAYCNANCNDYCAQDDRTDGLSGSVSADTGEVGLLGGTWGQGTVPKGDDKPPSIKLPGLDFTSDAGKKLIGY